jgi:hypothetical protein
VFAHRGGKGAACDGGSVRGSIEFVKRSATGQRMLPLQGDPSQLWLPPGLFRTLLLPAYRAVSLLLPCCLWGGGVLDV